MVEFLIQDEKEDKITYQFAPGQELNIQNSTKEVVIQIKFIT